MLQLSNDPETQAGLKTRRPIKFRTVPGVANGRGGDHASVLHAHVPKQELVPAQRRERLSLAFVGEISVVTKARAQSRHHLLVEDRCGGPLPSGIDDEAHGVRTDVDDCDGLARQGRYRPRWKRSFGTLRPFFSACPRPDSDGLLMKYSCRLNASFGLGRKRS